MKFSTNPRWCTGRVAWMSYNANLSLRWWNTQSGFPFTFIWKPLHHCDVDGVILVDRLRHQWNFSTYAKSKTLSPTFCCLCEPTHCLQLDLCHWRFAYDKVLTHSVKSNSSYLPGGSQLNVHWQTSKWRHFKNLGELLQVTRTECRHCIYG